jgi:UDP-N-acetylglucosamine:LPS N-acetylglucosamine transferase
MRRRNLPRPGGYREPEAGRLRVLLVCSSGGHLDHLDRLRPWWEQHERKWVTFPGADSESVLAGEDVTWAYHPTTRNIPNLLRNLGLAWRVLRHDRPDLVVSTGAGVAFPFFALARLFGVETVYLEVYDRIDLPTLTGRLCYPLSHLFLLQWPEQRRFYPRGVIVGGLY